MDSTTFIVDSRFKRVLSGVSRRECRISPPYSGGSVWARLGQGPENSSLEPAGQRKQSGTGLWIAHVETAKTHVYWMRAKSSLEMRREQQASKVAHAMAGRDS